MDIFQIWSYKAREFFNRVHPKQVHPKEEEIEENQEKEEKKKK